MAKKSKEGSNISRAHFWRDAKAKCGKKFLIKIHEISEAHVVEAVASNPHNNGQYFFGVSISRLKALVKLENPFIVLVCGDIKKNVMIPAGDILEYLDQNKLSVSDGQCKIHLDLEWRLVFNGGGTRDYKKNVDRWDLLKGSPKKKK